MEENNSMDWSNLNIKAKELIYLVSFIVTMIIGFSSFSNKVDKLSDKVTEKIETDKEQSKDQSLWRRTIENNVNANSLQIKLMQQDVEMIKQGFYPTKE